ncbi:hypothetical protein [Lysinibacillus xylanilyticus]|uniref:hypothetical protein n=1 Tax=Lysinibacillus xylanilyticus TaxID=582475 RepID=UPI0036D849D9
MGLLVEVLRGKNAKELKEVCEGVTLPNGLKAKKHTVTVETRNHLLDFVLVEIEDSLVGSKQDLYDLYNLEAVWPKYGENANCRFPAHCHTVVINRSIFFSDIAFDITSDKQARFRKVISDLNLDMTKLTEQDVSVFIKRYDLEVVFVDNYLQVLAEETIMNVAKSTIFGSNQ